MAASTAGSMALVSVIWTRPLSLTIFSGASGFVHISLKTFFAILPEIVSFMMSRIISPRRLASTGDFVMSMASSLRFFERSPMIQFAASFGSAPVATTAS